MKCDENKTFLFTPKSRTQTSKQKTKQKQDQKGENPYSRLTTEYVKECHEKQGRPEGKFPSSQRSLYIINVAKWFCTMTVKNT